MLRRFAVSGATSCQRQSGFHLLESYASQNARFASSTSSSGSTGILLGNKERGVRTSDASATQMGDIANAAHSNLSSSRKLPAGDLLGTMDLCAANVAQLHCTGGRKFGMATSVATVAVDQTNFMKPVLGGDMVIVEGRAIHAGSSSVGVAVEVSRVQFPTRHKTLVCNSFFTMVAIDDKLRKANVVPALELSTEKDVLLNKQYLTSLALGKKAPQDRLKEVIRLAEAAEPSAVTATSRVLSEAKAYDLECEPNKTKRTKVSFEETRTEANRVFFSQFLNMNNTIFGGELMRWMELHAVHCGRMFSGNRDMRSLGMYNVSFNDAVQVQMLVTLNAHVVYVHRTTMEVEVEIGVEGPDRTIITNRASFILANFDEAGQLIEIPNGLELNGASKEWLSRYADGRARYEVGRLSRYHLKDAFAVPARK